MFKAEPMIHPNMLDAYEQAVKVVKQQACFLPFSYGSSAGRLRRAEFGFTGTLHAQLAALRVQDSKKAGRRTM